MLISSFLSCVLLLVQSAICSDLQQDTPSVNEKSSKQLATDLNTDTYGYHHPPLPEVNEQKGSRKEKSLNIDEQTTTQRTYSRGFKPRARPKTSTPSLEIPVQVIHETTPTTVTSTSQSTTSPIDKTTKVFVPRRQFYSNTIKKTDIIETTTAPNNIATENDKEYVPMIMKKNENYVSTTEVPRRFRGRLLNTKKKIEITEKTEETSNIPTENVTENVPEITEKDNNDVTTRNFQRRLRDRLSNTNKMIEMTEKPAETNNNPTENVTENVPIITEKDSNDVTTRKFQMRSRGRLSNTNKIIEITEKPAEMNNDPTENVTENVPTITEKDGKDVATRKFQMRLRDRFSNTNKIIGITEKPIDMTNEPTEKVTENVPTIAEKDSTDVTTRKFQMRSRGRLSNTNKIMEITEKPAEMSNITTKNVTEDLPIITKKDYSKVTLKFPTRSRGRQLNLNKKVDIGETTAPTNNIFIKNNTEDLPSFTEKDENVVSTTAVSKRLSERKLNTNKKIDIRETTAATINIASENVTEDMVTLKEKDKGFVLTTEFPKKSRGSYYNTNKKVVIRQISAATSEVPTENSTGDVSTFTKQGKNYVSTTEFPKRSRGSYFKKRTGTPTPKVKILEEQNFVYSHSGNFHYSYLGGDGTKVSSEGSLKSYDNNKTGEAVSGSVFYTDKDGTDYSLSYTADENGYRPVGAHLPTPPPVPPAIARALKYIADKNKSTPTPLAKSD